MGKLKNKIKKELNRDVRRVKVEVYQDVKYIKTHIPKVITSFIILAFFIILFVLFKTKQGDKFNQSPNKMIALVNTKNYVIKPTKVSDFLKDKSTDYQLIDIRSSQERRVYKIDESSHIPFERILEKEYRSLWNNNTIKVLVSENDLEATQAWLILKELGYKNIQVLEGGIDFWKEDMKSEFGLKVNRSKDDEAPKYDFAKTMADFKKKK